MSKQVLAAARTFSVRRLRAMTHVPVLRRRALVAALAAAVVALGIWQYGRINQITETDARVMADMITVSSRVDGWVAKRTVTDGQSIATGNELVVIDQREAEQQLAALRASAQSIRLQRERALVQLQVDEGTSSSAVTAAEARRTAAIANLHSAESELQRTREDFQRADALLASQFVSRQSWDLRQSQTRKAEEAYRGTQAQLAEAEASLVEAKAKLGTVDVQRKEVERLEHDAEQVAAQVHQLEIELGDRVVRSPIDGVVDRKFVEPGEYVIPGQRLLLIHDPKAVWVEANVKETKLERLRPGQPVTISVDAYSDRTFRGTIERVGDAATSQFALLPSPNPSGNFTKITQRVPVRIRVDQPDDNPLRPGMMVEVDIDAGHR
ncbi:HlyD family secretion protein [Telmatospirillum sp.]|uniref:HlyD family secretion protein n=1 Tax=Telmatospirillum sp. TaxID=2079197 RepID=UPI002841D91F|nr:HlyD family secretion protein [Telmatospirillum sp.]MDR3436256.1 HlyD family secretion protein [Telmatospirillum sp.]